MKSHLIGFIVSALMHSAVIFLLIDLDQSEASKLSTVDPIPLTLAMFQDQPVIEETPILQQAEPENIAAKNTEPLPEKVEPMPVSEAEIVSEPQPELELIEKPIVSSEPEIKPDPEPLLESNPKFETNTVFASITPVVPVKKPKEKKPRQKKPAKQVVKPVLTPKKVVQSQQKKIVDKSRAYKPKKALVKAQPVKKQLPKTTHGKARPNKAPVKQVRQQQTSVKKPAVSPKTTAAVTGTRRLTPQPPVNNVNMAAVENAYKARLRQLIIANKRYPKRAKRRRQQGTVNISFLILANGTVTNIRAVKSSGHVILDDSAIKAIKQISGKLPFPKEINKKQWLITIPVTYQLR